MSTRTQSSWRTLMRFGVVSLVLSAVAVAFMAIPSAEEAEATAEGYISGRNRRSSRALTRSSATCSRTLGLSTADLGWCRIWQDEGDHHQDRLSFGAAWSTAVFDAISNVHQ